MPLYRATALIAVVLIVLLAAGYAIAERELHEAGIDRIQATTSLDKP